MEKYNKFIKSKTYYFVRVFPFIDSDQEKPVTDINKISATPFWLAEEILELTLDRNVMQLDSEFSLVLYQSENFIFESEMHIKPGDWVVIYKTSSGGFTDPDLKVIEETIEVKIDGAVKKFVVFKRGFGQVERAESDWSVTNEGTCINTMFVSGRTFGKFLSDANLYFNPFQEGNMKPAMIPASIKIPQGNMKNAITEILSFAMAMNQVVLPQTIMSEKVFAEQENEIKPKDNINVIKDFKGSTAFNILNLKIDDTTSETFIDYHTVEDGSVENLIKYFSDQVKNEVYCDLIWDAKIKALSPTLVIRETPYTIKSIWDNKYKQSSDLPRNYFEDQFTYEIDWEDGTINRFRIGRSSHEIFNYFVTTGRMYPQGEMLNKQEQMNFENIQIEAGKSTNKIARFGLKIKQASTIYDNYSRKGNQGGTIFNTSEEYSRLQRHWFSDMDLKYSGTISGHFPNYLRLGTRIRVLNVPVKTKTGIDKRVFEAYVVGITDSFQAPNIPLITLRVHYGRILKTTNSRQAS